MNLYVTAHPPRIVFELPARGAEGIANGDVNVLVRPADFEVLDPLGRAALHYGAALRRFVPHDDFRARHVDGDTDVKSLAGAVLPVGASITT